MTCFGCCWRGMIRSLSGRDSFPLADRFAKDRKLKSDVHNLNVRSEASREEDLQRPVEVYVVAQNLDRARAEMGEAIYQWSTEWRAFANRDTELIPDGISLEEYWRYEKGFAFMLDRALQESLFFDFYPNVAPEAEERRRRSVHMGLKKEHSSK
uniref:Uncharacterized protein n=1 Tax=Ditylenchus dipsaci TaxID=166011 RepID=A0A915E1Q3_9BILA